MQTEVMVFTNLVNRAGNFDKDPKHGILTVAREGIVGNYLSETEAPESPLDEAPVPANDFRDLEVGSQWKPRDGVSKVTSANGDFEWYVLIPFEG